jgi:hypothetical protein
MTASTGNTANPFGNNAEIGVGFSDAALLAASVIGFLILASTVSSTLVMYLTSSEEVAKEKVAGGNGDEEQLVHADVSTVVMHPTPSEEVAKEILAEETGDKEQLVHADVSALDRSEHGACAPEILKQQRRVRRALSNAEFPDAELDVGSDTSWSEDGDGDAKESEEGVTLSLKDIQNAAKAKEKLLRAAKAAERAALRVLEDARHEQEKQAQDDARKQKREEEREEAQKQEAARLEAKKQKEELEMAEFEASKVFLSSPSRSQSVQEWIDEMKDKRTVLITEMATSFKLPKEKVVQRIQELIKEGRVAGVMDENGRFIFIAEDELHSIAKSLIERGSLSLTDVAVVCNAKLGSVRGY